jgi:hypothetical protein
MQASASLSQEAMNGRFSVRTFGCLLKNLGIFSASSDIDDGTGKEGDGLDFYGWARRKRITAPAHD